MQKLDEIIDMLTFVAKGRTFVEHVDAWDYGWCLEEHRRSPDATIQFNATRAVKLSRKAVRAFETVGYMLSRDADILARWDKEEFWGILASLVGTLPETEDEKVLRASISNRLRLLAAPGSVVAFPIANTQWKREPLVIADVVIGIPNDAWLGSISSSASGRPVVRRSKDLWWLAEPLDDGVVAVAVWVSSLGHRAVKEAEERFSQLVELSLLFEADLDAREIWSGRGSPCRPGVRGLSIDRYQLVSRNKVLPKRLSRELSASFFVNNDLGITRPVHWFGENPFPIDELLLEPKRKAMVSNVMTLSSDVCHRLRLAARWHAKAHWSLESEDAVLSLGVAFDALLGEAHGPQRREIAERFALLESDPLKREAAYRTCSELYYTARSQVAHGQSCPALERPHFCREMSAALRMKAADVYALAVENGIQSEADYATMFTSLKWGTVHAE
jgi:hypothetical protein